MLEKIIHIVKEASKIMLDDKSFRVDEKDGATNLVTSNDYAVQNFLQKELSHLLQESSFYCEEGNIKDLSKDYIWIIDPIDGTTNYARHISVCAISVALEYKGEIIIGVVYNPYQNLLYYAKKSEGAFLNGERIHTSDKLFNQCVMYTAFSAYDKSKSHIAFSFAKKIFPKVNDLRRTGSAAFEICSIASGRGDLFLEMKLQVWDYAAASLILKEAGGYISGIKKDDLPLDHPSIIIAGNTKENYLTLLKEAQEHFGFDF